MPEKGDQVSDDMRRWLLLGSPSLVVIAVFFYLYPAVDLVALLCMCVLCVSGARLLQSMWLQRKRPVDENMKNHLNENVSDRKAFVRPSLCELICSSLAILVFCFLLSPTVPSLVIDHLSLVVMGCPLLAFAFQQSYTPRVEIADEQAKASINLGEGIAWIFFLGYLDKIFNEDTGKMFETRMQDYLSAQGVDEEGRDLTCKNRMFILVPTDSKAIMSDKDFGEDDDKVKREKKLAPAYVEGERSQRKGRSYGDTQVYTVEYDGKKYRLAMELASALRTAALAAEDADATWVTASDYVETADRFVRTLQEILQKKTKIGNQVELVRIDDRRTLGEVVARRFRELRRLEEVQQKARELREAEGEAARLTDELQRAGSVAVPRASLASSEAVADAADGLGDSDLDLK